MNQRQTFDQVASQLGLDTDQRASLLVLQVEPYLEWLESGKGLEISRRRLKEITETLRLLVQVYSSDPGRGREWLYSSETNMGPRIPAAVLRVGKVSEVRDQIEGMTPLA